MPSSVVHNDDNRWQAIFIEYFLYVYGNRQAVNGHGREGELDFWGLSLNSGTLSPS